MRNLLETRLQRHLDILGVLLDADWITVMKVAEQTGLSERTIRNDLQYIGEYIAPFRIETSIKSGIKLHRPPHYSDKYIFSAILKESLPFQLLEKIFMGTTATIATMAETFFISESTLKREIRKINVGLASYGFKIKAEPFRLVGREKKICNFIHYYLLEKYDLPNHFLSTTQLQVIDELIFDFIHTHNHFEEFHQLNFAYMNRLRTMIYTTILRTKQRNHQKHSAAPHQYQINDSLRTRLSASFSIDFSPDELTHIFYIFLNPDYATSYVDLQEKCLADTQINQIVQLIQKLITHSVELCGAAEVEWSTLLLTLYNHFTYNYGPSYILYNRPKNFFGNLYRYYGYGHLITELRQVFKNSIASIPHLAGLFSPAIQDDMIYFLVTQWGSTCNFAEQFIVPIRAGLLMTTSKSHTLFLKKELSYHLKNHFDFVVIDGLSLEEMMTNAADCELLVTNMAHLQSLNRPVVTIHTAPTPEDYQQLLLAYEGLTRKQQPIMLRQPVLPAENEALPAVSD